MARNRQDQSKDTHMTRVSSATFCETRLAIKSRMCLWVSCACCGVATWKSGVSALVREVSRCMQSAAHLAGADSPDCRPKKSSGQTPIARKCISADGNSPAKERKLTRLVGDDNVLPVLLADDLGESVDLAVDDLLGPVRVALLERLADAEDDLDASLERLRGLVRGAISVSAIPGGSGLTPGPEGNATRRTFSATSSSVSWKRVRRSEWPRMTQFRPMSFSWESLARESGRARRGQFSAAKRHRATGSAQVYGRPGEWTHEISPV